MISRSNYIAIVLIMCCVFLMFQLTGISEDMVMSTGENIYASEAAFSEADRAQKQEYDRIVASLSTVKTSEAFVGLVGEEKDSCLQVGESWSISQKKTYCSYDTLEQAADDEDGAQFLIVNGGNLTSEDVPALEKLMEQGRCVVVSDLPGLSELRQEKELCSSLGIIEVNEEVTLEGVKLFAGLLLGGESVYKEYEQTVPYLRLGDSVTSYMVAWAESGWLTELEDTDYPVLIWSYSPGRGTVYVVNGDYLTGQMGAGLLTGFAANAEELYLYPVVNAQISVVENYPMIADENSQYMQSEYGLDSSNVFRDIVWPSIVAINYDSGDALTATASLRYDYTQSTELDLSLIELYYTQITKESGEIGLSAGQISDVPLEQKLAQDLALYEETLPDYRFIVFQAGDLETEEYVALLDEGELLETIRTVLVQYDENSAGTFFSYTTDTVLELPVYMESTVMQCEDDFRARCLQTAYGYYATQVDAMRVVYPQSEDDVWNVMSADWAKNYRPYRVPFEIFDKMTATEADERVRNYLSLEYDVQREDNIITLTVDSGQSENYFILRLHGDEIAQVTGGTCEEIETGWYLVTTAGDTVQLELEQSDHAKYYIE